MTLLFIANAINIGADLSAMADASKLLIGGPGFLYVTVFATICVAGIVFTSYDRYVMVLKWLTLSLFAYVAALFAAHVHWGQALAGLFLPRITWSSRLLHHPGRHPRHHDFALPVLLASLAGGRRWEGQSAAKTLVRAPRRPATLSNASAPIPWSAWRSPTSLRSRSSSPPLPP